MTSTVSFQFASPQFALDAGSVAFTKGARLFSDGEFRIGEIKNGAIDGVLVEGPIEVDATLFNLRVVRHSDRQSYQVLPFKLTQDLREEDLRAGRVLVQLDLPVVIILRVENETGQAMPDVQVGLMVPNSESTAETRTDGNGEIVMLGAVGHYSASVGFVGSRRLWPPLLEEFYIDSSDSGERVIVLRVPPIPNP